jgi:hypothetical protein
MSEHEYKYLVLFPVPKPHKVMIERLAEKVSAHTGLPSPYRGELGPHMTFHRPIEGIEEDVVLTLAKSVSLQCKPTRVTVDRLAHFGKHYIVLPVQTTLANAYFWVRLTAIFAEQPEYEHGPFDFDNTLHISIASKTSEIFDKAWPMVRAISVSEMNIPMDKVALCRKPLSGGDWEKIAEFNLHG